MTRQEEISANHPSGGPQFPHTEAISFGVFCDDQDEIDYYWNKLGEGGNPQKQVCGWVGDKYGVSVRASRPLENCLASWFWKRSATNTEYGKQWQVIPRALADWISTPGEKGERATRAMLQMKKLDIEGLKKAFEGEEDSVVKD